MWSRIAIFINPSLNVFIGINKEFASFLNLTLFMIRSWMLCTKIYWGIFTVWWRSWGNRRKGILCIKENICINHTLHRDKKCCRAADQVAILNITSLLTSYRAKLNPTQLYCQLRLSFAQLSPSYILYLVNIDIEIFHMSLWHIIDKIGGNVLKVK
jgi:hypothetical protein